MNSSNSTKRNLSITFYTNHRWLLLIAITCCFFTIACETNLEEVRQILSKKDAAIEQGKEVKILYSSNGKVIYKISGDKLIRHHTADPYIEFPEGVILIVYDDSMNIESKLNADYGINYERQRKMIVKGDVVLVSNKGEKLVTEELIWDEVKKKVFSDKYVEITTPTEIIYGDGFESDDQFTNYKIKKMRGVIDINDNNDSIKKNP